MVSGREEFTHRSYREKQARPPINPTSIAILTSFFLPFCLFLYFFSSAFTPTRVILLAFVNGGGAPATDPCEGRYIYMHDLPAEFNSAMLNDCRSLIKWFDICPYVVNQGLGQKLEGSRRRWGEGGGWYDTNQFMLEVIFHERMKRYRCLTNVSEKASAIFVPFYGGLDAGRFLWEKNISARDAGPTRVVEWVKGKREWGRMWGRDHFLVVGRIFWDFIRVEDDDSQWGNKLLRLPESKNMSFLGIESVTNPEIDNDISIPYPTYFHPSSDAEVLQWQTELRRSRRRRRHLFSFVGGPRPEMATSVRGHIISQCATAGGKCKLVTCTNTPNICEDPTVVMSTFLHSTFCLQPTGDSITRRSIFDSILAGCIPVFFHDRDSASSVRQYPWHLPPRHSLYSVFLPEGEVMGGRLDITEALEGVPETEVAAMREEVIRLIPAVVYAAPESELQKVEDAFDIAVERVLARVEERRRESAII